MTNSGAFVDSHEIALKSGPRTPNMVSDRGAMACEKSSSPDNTLPMNSAKGGAFVRT